MVHSPLLKHTPQVGAEQAAFIRGVLGSGQNRSFLVWGLGYDSVYWDAATKGRVVFLENNQE